MNFGVLLLKVIWDIVLSAHIFRRKGIVAMRIFVPDPAIFPVDH